MKKINFNSIKSKMIIGYASMALLILIVVFITLSQIRNIMVMGIDVLENKQPSRMYVAAMKSGVRQSNIRVQHYLLTANQKLQNQVDAIWASEVQSAKDSLDSLMPTWENPENLILYEKITRLAERIQNNQKQLMNEAQFGGADISLSLSDYAGMQGDTLYDANDLQNWINDKLSSLSSTSNPNGGLYAENLQVLSNEFDENADVLYSNLEQESLAVADKIFAARDRFIMVESSIVVLSIILCFLLYRLARKQIKGSLHALQSEVKILSEGNIPETKAKTHDEFDIILEEIHTLSENLSNVKNFALEVGKGSFDNDISVFNNEGDIGSSLAEMRESLKNVSEEARVRNWTNKGSAEFGDLLRKYNNNIAELSDHVITFMVNYLAANQGSIFIVDENESGDEALYLTSTYAYDRKKFLEKIIEPGQGLVGQVFLEKQSIYLKELPENYVTITSGLGNAAPRNIFIVPLIANGTVYGVIEIGSFKEFSDDERAFIESVSENIASSIQAVKINERTNKLLEESQEMTEQMRSQEEEMRQNMEELQATQEEMERSQKETQARMNSIATNGLAFIEFTPDGHILNADNTFLEFMEYSLDEIEGRHHQIFVDPQYAKSDDYKKMWSDLRSGKKISGIFKRFTKSGRKVYIKGAYSNLKDGSDKIKKIFKSVVDVTDLYTKAESLLQEKEDLLKQLEETNRKIQNTKAGELDELKAYQAELKKSLLNKLQTTKEELKTSLEKEK
jgi:PAS domain S-box-containing protein